MPTLLLPYYFLIGLSGQFNLMFLPGPLHILLQNPHNNVFAFFPSVLQYCFFASPPFFLFIYSSVLPHCCSTQHCSGSHVFAFRKAVPWKIVRWERTLAGSSWELRTTFPWWSGYVSFSCFDPFIPMISNLFPHPQDWNKPLQHHFAPSNYTLLWFYLFQY